MKWLMTLVVGVLLGGGAVLYFLNKVPLEPAPVPMAVKPVAAAPDLPTSSAATETVTPAAVQLPASSLPDSGVVVPPAPAADPNAPAAVPETALLVPVEGIVPGKLSDTYNQPRGSERQHQALDIMAPKETKVLAVADGTLAKLFTSKPGGLTIYQFDPSEKYAFYYAHLDSYAPGMVEGKAVKRGELIGYVGSTGNADPAAPHLHFAIFELGPKKEWWKGKAINPYPYLLGQPLP